MLGVFFPLYASDGGSNQESISEAILPTLHTLIRAPVHSPLADIDIDDVANFLISITSPAIISEGKKDVSHFFSILTLFHTPLDAYHNVDMFYFIMQ